MTWESIAWPYTAVTLLTSVQFDMYSICLLISPWDARSNARTLLVQAAPCRPPPDRRPVVRPDAPSPDRLRSASPLASSWQPVIKGSPYHNRPSLYVVLPRTGYIACLHILTLYRRQNLTPSKGNSYYSFVIWLITYLQLCRLYSLKWIIVNDELGRKQLQ